MSKPKLPEYVDENLEPIGRLLFAQDIPALERALASGWDINRAVRLGDSVEWSPINIALSHGKRRLLEFLLRNGVELNGELFNPLISAIGDGCSVATIEKLMAHGARLDVRNHVGTGAYEAALSANRMDLFPELLRLGLPVDADGGWVLRSAVLGRRLDAVKFFVEHGHDVNLRTADNPTAVAVAASIGDLAMVRYLVEHGADITLRDEYGVRPYAAATAHRKVQQYLKKLEPAAWHDPESRLKALRPYKLPPNLVRFLRSKQRRIKIKGCFTRFIEFHPLTDVREMKWRRRKVLDLLAVVDNYDAIGFLVWSPQHRKLANADIEHEGFTVLCTWGEFVKDPSKWIKRCPS